VNEVDGNGRNALMFASFYNNVDAVELLAATGALINTTDNRFRTCLHYASLNDNSKIIEAVFLSFKN
jgi:ankyrin repeat protein